MSDNNEIFKCKTFQDLTKDIYENSQKKKFLITEFTKNGFRRNYDHMYIPVCTNCRLCVSSRIDVQNFMLSKSNKRNLYLNKDLVLKKKVVNLNNQRFKLFY